MMKRRGKKGSIAFMMTGIGNSAQKRRKHNSRPKVRSSDNMRDRGFISSMDSDSYRSELKRRVRGL